MLTLDGHYGDPAGSPCDHAPRKLRRGVPCHNGRAPERALIVRELFLRGKPTARCPDPGPGPQGEKFVADVPAWCEHAV
jgi:hypothetical protein